MTEVTTTNPSQDKYADLIERLEKAEAGSRELDACLRNSYKDFHARGLDYLCLHRSPQYTLKAYFLTGESASLPEVVNPHDHRYTFRTKVLAGGLVNYTFCRDQRGDRYDAFNYFTPLNGGSGFEWRGSERLSRDTGHLLRTGDSLTSTTGAIHTIESRAQGTVLLLEQFGDDVPVGAPTSCWVRKGHPKPNTSGLYDRFTPDEFLERIALLRALQSKT